MKAIYMTYCKDGDKWVEYVPSRTRDEAQGFIRLLKSDDAKGAVMREYKVKKIMVSDGEYDIITSEYGLEE